LWNELKVNNALDIEERNEHSLHCDFDMRASLGRGDVICFLDRIESTKFHRQ
jgi:hypothetical protein